MIIRDSICNSCNIWFFISAILWISNEGKKDRHWISKCEKGDVSKSNIGIIAWRARTNFILKCKFSPKSVDNLYIKHISLYAGGQFIFKKLMKKPDAEVNSDQNYLFISLLWHMFQIEHHCSYCHFQIFIMGQVQLLTPKFQTHSWECQTFRNRHLSKKESGKRPMIRTTTPYRPFWQSG